MPGEIGEKSRWLIIIVKYFLKKELNLSFS
jgi:hypothetical protein